MSLAVSLYMETVGLQLSQYNSYTDFSSVHLGLHTAKNYIYFSMGVMSAVKKRTYAPGVHEVLDLQFIHMLHSWDS